MNWHQISLTGAAANSESKAHAAKKMAPIGSGAGLFLTPKLEEKGVTLRRGLPTVSEPNRLHKVPCGSGNNEARDDSAPFHAESPRIGSNAGMIEFGKRIRRFCHFAGG
jgi:hypothetical protein